MVASCPTREGELDVHPELDDGSDLSVDERAREAVLGNAEHHHPSQTIGSFVDRHGVPQEPQLVGCCEAGGSAPDHADGGKAGLWNLSVCLVPDAVGGEALDAELFRDEALEGADGHRSVDRSASAGGLARCGTDPSADRSEWVGRPGDEIRVAVTTLRDGCDIGAGVGMDGARRTARLVVPQPPRVRHSRRWHLDQASRLESSQPHASTITTARNTMLAMYSRTSRLRLVALVSTAFAPPTAPRFRRR